MVRYHVPFWVAAPIALVVGTLFAVLVEVAVIRRLFNSPRVIVLVATIGIAELALAVASAFPSTGSTYMGYPVAVSGTWTVAGIQVTGAQLSTLVVVPIFGIALAWFLNRTTVGKTVQASSDNPDLARLSAISPKQVSTLVWAIAGLVGTVALILVAGQGLSASQIAQLGPDTLAQALVAAVIAGLRSFPRARGGGSGHWDSQFHPQLQLHQSTGPDRLLPIRCRAYCSLVPESPRRSRSTDVSDCTKRQGHT